MKTIGFVDYYLDEWHANNYPDWIRQLNRGYEVTYAWGEIDSPKGGLTTDAWCEKYGVTRCATIEELCEKADFILILSPDNPENHLRYAKAVFPCRKPCYIDKTFALDRATAEAIFAEAEKYGVPTFSSSALRFAAELRGITDPVQSVSVNGWGAFDIYTIHFTEIAVRLLGSEVDSVMVTNHTKNVTAALLYRDGRTASLNMFEVEGAPGFSVSVEWKKNKPGTYLNLSRDFFMNLLSAVLDMFDGKGVPVKKEETIAVIALIEAIRRARETPFTLVKV